MRPRWRDRIRYALRRLRCRLLGHPKDVPAAARACYRCSGWIKHRAVAPPDGDTT